MRLDPLKRRDFIALLGSAATWPVAARAQHPALPVIGYLSSLTQADSVRFDVALRHGLSDGVLIDQFASNAHKLEPFVVSLKLSGLCTSRARQPLLTQDRPADRFILMIDDLAVAHAVHVLGVAHWIGGVAAVTTVVLPQAQLLPDANAAIAAWSRTPWASPRSRSKDKSP